MELNVKESEMFDAIRNNDPDTVERLLLEGVNPNKKFTVYNSHGKPYTSCFLSQSLLFMYSFCFSILNKKFRFLSFTVSTR